MKYKQTIPLVVMIGMMAGCCARAPSNPYPLIAAHQMYAAAVDGDIVKASRLIKQTPSLINATAGNAFGSTPLHFAAYNGKTQFATWLLKHGADYNAQNIHGVTPLHDASSQGHLDIVSMLIARKASLDVKDDKGKTALQYALDNNHKEVAELLRRTGAGKDDSVRNEDDQPRP